MGHTRPHLLAAGLFLCIVWVPTRSVRAEPTPPVHKHKVFVDEAQRKIFWPMDQPFWVRLAPSPEEGSPSYLLQRVAPESTTTTEKYNKEGIRLEIQGKQFIRWFNFVTKETVHLQFFSDGEPPVSKASCGSAPSATGADGKGTLYGKGLRCSVTSEDALSGVESTFVAVGDGPFTVHKGELMFDEEKDVTLTYYAVDQVGYANKPSSLRFTVDLTPPVTAHQVVGNALDLVLSSQAAFGLSGSDRLSGLESIQTRLDAQGDFRPLRGPSVPVAALSDGEHVLEYFGIDRVSNREKPHEVRFYVDTTPPAVEARIVGDHQVGQGGINFISPRTTVVLSARDNKVGVEEIAYAMGGEKFVRYTGPLSLPQKTGDMKVAYRAADKLGNTSGTASLDCRMDLTPPVSTHRFEGPSFAQRSVVWITKETRVRLSGSDESAGLRRIEYQAASEPATYTEPLAFPTEGRQLLRFWSIDNVNNRELDQALVLITDNSAPEIFTTFSVTSPGQKTAEGGESLPVYPRFTTLFLGATDNSAGIKGVYYSIGGGVEKEYQKTLLFDREGSFDLVVRAEDNVGNSSTRRLKFAIQD